MLFQRSGTRPVQSKILTTSHSDPINDLPKTMNREVQASAQTSVLASVQKSAQLRTRTTPHMIRSPRRLRPRNCRNIGGRAPERNRMTTG